MKLIACHIPAEIRWDESVIKEFKEGFAYYVDGHLINIEGRTIRLETQSEHPAAQLQVASLAGRIAARWRDANDALLFEHSADRESVGVDPMPYLIEKGHVLQTGRGRFVYGGIVAKLLVALDSFIGSYARRRGAQELVFPTSVATETLLRSGYLRSFPHHALFVAPAKLSSRSLDYIGNCVSVSEIDARDTDPALGAHAEVLAPTVCYHCMEVLKESSLDNAREMTGIGICHRFESTSDSSLDRLQTFRMREVVNFGSEQDVTRMLDETLQWTADTSRRWDLTYRATTATDPFFAGAVDKKTYFQSLFALKREFRLRIECKDQWLSVASFNNHRHSLTDVFGIKGASGKISSGCVGWGYERLIYALFAQHGTDVSRWPSAIRTDLNGALEAQA